MPVIRFFMCQQFASPPAGPDRVPFASQNDFTKEYGRQVQKGWDSRRRSGTWNAWFSSANSPITSLRPSLCLTLVQRIWYIMVNLLQTFSDKIMVSQFRGIMRYYALGVLWQVCFTEFQCYGTSIYIVRRLT